MVGSDPVEQDGPLPGTARVDVAAKPQQPADQDQNKRFLHPLEKSYLRWTVRSLILGIFVSVTTLLIGLPQIFSPSGLFGHKEQPVLEISEASAELMLAFDDVPAAVHLLIEDSGSAIGPQAPTADYDCVIQPTAGAPVHVNPVPDTTVPCGFELSLASSIQSSVETALLVMHVEHRGQTGGRDIPIKVNFVGIHEPRIVLGPPDASDGSRLATIALRGVAAHDYSMSCYWTDSVRDRQSCETSAQPNGNSTPKKIMAAVTLTKKDDPSVHRVFRIAPVEVDQREPAAIEPDTAASHDTRQGGALSVARDVPAAISEEHPTEAPRETSVTTAMQRLNDVADAATRKRIVETQILPRLLPPLSASDVSVLVGGFDGYDRADLIQKLAGCIRLPVGASDRESILEGLSGPERDWADAGIRHSSKPCSIVPPPGRSSRPS